MTASSGTTPFVRPLSADDRDGGAGGRTASPAASASARTSAWRSGGA